MKKIYLILFGIVILAVVLRFWKLGQVPPSPDWDEVALGYNAYSILQTGKDEYGEPFPTILRSFDDYKPALYVYSVIPFIILFDVTTFAVRLPSAIFGVLAVVGTFFLVCELFKRNNLALLSSFLLAISPWHIQFSRIAFEANLGVTLNIFGILFFLIGLRRKLFLPFSIIFFSLGLYAYQSEKVFVPLIVLILFINFRKKFLSLPKKYLLMLLLLGVLLSFPIFSYTLLNQEALSRVKGVSVFSDITPFLQKNAQRYIHDIQNGDYLGLIFDNRRIEYAKAIISGYLSHLDLNWLFLRGDIPRHHAPNMGLMYLWELPFLLIGIYWLVFGKFERSAKFVLFAWFLASPVPASITSGVPHAVRTLNFLPTFQIFTAIGLIAAFTSMSNLKISHVPRDGIGVKYLIFLVIFLLSVFNFLYFLDQYFAQQNYFYSEFWQYGYKETVEKVKEIEAKYRKIVVSNEPYMDQSYMFFLFYLKYPPKKYLAEGGSESGGFAEEHKFGKYEFRPIKWDIETKERGTLYIGRPFDFPQNDRGHVKTFYFLNGKPAIRLVEIL